MEADAELPSLTVLCYDFFLASYSESLAFIPSGILSGALRKNFYSSLFSTDSCCKRELSSSIPRT